MTYQLHVGRCEEVLKTLPDNSVDAIPSTSGGNVCAFSNLVATCWHLVDHVPITDLLLTLRMLASKSGTKSYGFTVAASLSHTTSMVILMAGERR